MIGALLCRNGCADRPTVPPSKRPLRVMRAGDGFVAWAADDLPHASLASLPDTEGGQGPGIVCGVFGTLFGTDLLEDELAPFLPESLHPACPASLLAHGYRAMGRDFIAAAEGEFAVFLYDARLGRLITRTDDIGIGRLHYAHDAHMYCVCTDLGALLSTFRPAGVRTRALREYFFLGYVPSPQTAYDGVCKSMPGHSRVLAARAWQLRDVGRHSMAASRKAESPLAGATTVEAEDIVLAAIERSIARRLDGATSATVLLTSGYDSTLCAAILKSQCDRVRSYTIGFEERAVNENADAGKIAMHLGLEHRDLMFSADRLLDSLVAWVQAHAEPWCHPNGLSTYVAHGEIRRDSDDVVVFDGSGGDYLFRDFGEIATMVAQLGKVPTALVPRLLYALPSPLRRLIFRVRETLPSWRVREAVKRAYRATLRPADRLVFHNPWNAADYLRLLGTEFVLADTRPGREYFSGGREPLDRYLAYYRSWGFDASVGRAVLESRLQGMRATFPYEDAELVQLVDGMPRRPSIGDDDDRYLQENLSKRFIPPQYFASRKKAMETPLELILNSARGRDLVEHHFAAARTRNDSIYDRRYAEAVKDRFYSGDSGCALKVWSVLCFEIWNEAQREGRTAVRP